MKKIILLQIIVSILVFVGNVRSPSEPADDQPAAQPKIAPAIVAANLEIPWALDFLPDGSILFTERSDKIRSRRLSLPNHQQPRWPRESSSRRRQNPPPRP